MWLFMQRAHPPFKQHQLLISSQMTWLLLNIPVLLLPGRTRLIFQSSQNSCRLYLPIIHFSDKAKARDAAVMQNRLMGSQR